MVERDLPFECIALVRLLRYLGPVSSHFRLVAKIARGYRGYGLPIEDLISEGNWARGEM
jgi:hypothetical protein